MNKPKHIIIASKNPVKIKAVQAGFEKFFPSENFSFSGIDVPSNVSSQPMNHAETKEGAHNRALNAKIFEAHADYWVGIEGGVEANEEGMESFAWIFILDKNKVGVAKTASFFLPKRIVQLVQEGKELGEANDIIFEKHNSKQKNGAVGLLTANLIDRTGYYTEAVILALIPFFNKTLY